MDVEAISRMVERINTSTDLPSVDRDQPLLFQHCGLALMDSVQVLKRHLAYAFDASTALRHGLSMQLYLMYNANLFFTTRRLYTNKGYITF